MRSPPSSRSPPTSTWGRARRTGASGWPRKGPILTRLNVDDTWYAATANGGNLDAYLPDTTRGGHAVALVGYTSGRFIVRNSWGDDWGDGGFGYASLAYAQEAFTEAYGVEA